MLGKKLDLKAKNSLFGSRARGTHQSGTDIDIALGCTTPLSFQTILKIQNDIEQTTIPLTVDIIDLHTAPKKLCDEVEKEGVIWQSSH